MIRAHFVKTFLGFMEAVPKKVSIYPFILSAYQWKGEERKE
jgi:hypothetical protein